MPATTTSMKVRPMPERFQVAKATLWFDQFMTYFIQFGGIGVIIAVFGMMIFILAEILPLFASASVKQMKALEAAAANVEAVGMDEWGTTAYTFARDRREIEFFDFNSGTKTSVPFSLPEGTTITAFRFSPRLQQFVLGTGEGQFGTIAVRFSSAVENGVRKSVPEVNVGEFRPIGVSGAPIRQIDYGIGDDQRIAVVIQDVNGAQQLHAVKLVQKNTLMGRGELTVDQAYDLTGLLPESPASLKVPNTADSFLVATASGDIHYFHLGSDAFERRQSFRPFADLPNPSVASMDFVFGDVSLVLTNPDGHCRIFSLLIPKGETTRVFGQTKSFPKMPSGATFFRASQRNKAFLIGSGDFASLRHSTTETVRWEAKLPFTVQAATLDAKFHHIAFLGDDNKLHLYELRDPHPDAGWKAFFGKVWYEGQNEPLYSWQSSSGTDDFEPKFSLVPLVFGSLKGTLWAMMFALPIALLAAVYTSQFCHPKVKNVIKPTMEIMASLPSVVLGFLAALWLAPILNTRVPSFLLVVATLPVVAFLCGWIWPRVPVEIRCRLKTGYEFMAFIPIMLICGFIAWTLGPWVESWLFNGDFRVWWPQFAGVPYDQRNSLVVGFMMGFAVIPIIFTISEDALSNVPPALTSGSTALGASRWQTARNIVIPIASAGIFSAIMIGLGRAVGETMIVVMATGNTPIMDWNIFSGFRTLSANIAVELPEAPVDSTHYRALFLGAFVLFIMTFVLNTAAEVLRQRLREKFKLA